MKVWIRHLNGVVDDLGNATEAEALARFQEQDWDAEIEDYDPERDGPDHCLPAFGIVDGDAASCDITPTDADSCTINLYYHKPGRLFGIFPITRNAWEHLPGFPRNAVDRVISLFHARNIDGLTRLAAEARAGGKGSSPR